MSFLGRFSTILLDMNRTFMFGEDRFAEDEDFFATYRAVGGRRLDAAGVRSAIRACYLGLIEDYEDAAKQDDFPSLREAFGRHAEVRERDMSELEAVFARHELGEVPAPFADCLKRLAGTHTLGLVSNIWAPKDLWLQEFERLGLRAIWRTMVFSSDSRSMKPSPRLFVQALDACQASPGETLFVGDSLRCDIEPAKKLGLATAWLTRDATEHAMADRVSPSLLELVEIP